jgi:Raf kinase inhibitor-like YbhB/YbcL family protein
MSGKILKYLVLVLLIMATVQAENFTLESSDLKSEMSKTEEFKGFGCDGSNLSPALEWKGAPEGTKSFAVTLYDTTAHFWHWTIFDIPASQKGLAAGAGDPQKGLAPEGSIQGKNDYGLIGFGGPCPPKGDKPHTYIYTVYALKVAKLGADQHTNPIAVGLLLEKNALAKASIKSHYGR